MFERFQGERAQTWLMSDADDMRIEFSTSQNPEARSASAVTTPTDALPDASETNDDPWSFDEK